MSYIQADLALVYEIFRIMNCCFLADQKIAEKFRRRVGHFFLRHLMMTPCRSWHHTKGMNMSSKSSKAPSPSKPMTTVDAARIQGANAKNNGGVVNKGSFPARAQRAAAKNNQP